MALRNDKLDLGNKVGNENIVDYMGVIIIFCDGTIFLL